MTSLKEKSELTDVSDSNSMSSKDIEVSHTPTLEDADEISSQKTDSAETIPYSVYPQKIVALVVVVCACEGVLSSLAASSFYGCMHQVRHHFHINNQTVNIAIVVYFIFQGIAPTMVTFMVDSGRIAKRNTVFIGCVVYGAVNLVIANAPNFGTIIAMRCIQSFAISPVIAINSSIAADISTKEKRGNIIGLINGFQMCAGSAFGAVVSAGLTHQFGWKGVFYYLSIMAFTSSLIVFCILPETKRTECGNGSLIPKRFIDRAPITYTKYWKKTFYNKPYPESIQPKKPSNILGFWEIIKKREMLFLLMSSGMQYAMWSCHLTSLSTVLSGSHYNLPTLTIGKCYLPSGICTMLSVSASGYLLNWNYRRRRGQYDAWIKTQEQNEDFDLNLPKYQFNIYKARLEFANAPMIISGSCFVICGWLMETKQALAPILVFSGLGCLFSNCILTFSTTLIVDQNPFAGSTAAGVINLFRCLLSALFVGVLDPMFQNIGVGGAFVVMFGLSFFFSVFLYYSSKKGLELEYQRNLKKQQKDEQQKQEEIESVSTSSTKQIESVSTSSTKQIETQSITQK